MLSRLRTFVEVYRQRSISGAARSLELTQPAVSQHIASLESAIGRTLFERHPHGVNPTAAADELAAEIGDRHLDGLDAAFADHIGVQPGHVVDVADHDLVAGGPGGLGIFVIT